MSFASEVCLLLLVTYSALPGWINPHNFRKTYGVAGRQKIHSKMDFRKECITVAPDCI